MKIETCEVSCDENHCDVCRAQGLSELERVRVDYYIAKGQLEIKKQIMIDIEEVYSRAKEHLLCALTHYISCQKKLEKLENENYSNGNC